MIKRTIYFGNPARLSKKDSQLLIDFFEDGKESKTVPIEDIGVLVLDNYQLTITQALLSALLENNAAVLCTDSKHMPAAMFLNMQGHTELSEHYKWQLEASVPLKKNLWQQTVRAKLQNQAKLLEIYNQKFEDILIMANDVKSGDTGNNEAQAAAAYWKRLFDPELGFKRGRYEDAPNNLLNYGYATLRAVVARSLAASGLLCAFGIFHRNKYNPFCLADDIMEPYRPFVDQLVCTIIDSDIDYSELTPSIKKELLQIPALDIIIDGEKSPLMVGMQRTTASLARCYEGKTRQILYPELNT